MTNNTLVSPFPHECTIILHPLPRQSVNLHRNQLLLLAPVQHARLYTPPPPLPTHTHTLPLPTYLPHLPEPWMAPTHFSGCFACYLFLVPASFIWRFFGHFCFRTFVFGLIFVALTPTPSPLPWWTHYHFSWPSSDFLIKFLNLLHFTLCVLHLCP